MKFKCSAVVESLITVRCDNAASRCPVPSGTAVCHSALSAPSPEHSSIRCPSFETGFRRSVPSKTRTMFCCIFARLFAQQNIPKHFGDFPLFLLQHALHISAVVVLVLASFSTCYLPSAVISACLPIPPQTTSDQTGPDHTSPDPDLPATPLSSARIVGFMCVKTI